jgi:hypothetical protein
MKKIIIMLAVILLSLTGYAATKTATFTWTQPAADLPILAGWRVYSSATAGGPYTLLSSITYTGTPASSYTGTGTLTQADGTAKTWYFVCRALGKSGLESGNSNEVNAVIDLTVPGTPVTFTVTITN